MQSLYSNDLYSQLTRETWLFRGTQNNCSGVTPVDKVKEVFDKLNKKKECGIDFNKNKITGSVEGGTCTAMSLEFVDSLLKIKKNSPKCVNDKSKFNNILSLQEKFKQSSEEMRIRQAAYNTIEVIKGDYIDYSKNKMQSLLNFHDFKINYCSNEINTETRKEEFAKTVHELPKGTYILRVIKPNENEKLEEHGHTLVYVKEEDLGLFYDPNFGLRVLSEEEHSTVLLESFKFCYFNFQTSNARFYQIEKEVK